MHEAGATRQQLLEAPGTSPRPQLPVPGASVLAGEVGRSVFVVLGRAPLHRRGLLRLGAPGAVPSPGAGSVRRETGGAEPSAVHAVPPLQLLEGGRAGQRLPAGAVLALGACESRGWGPPAAPGLLPAAGTGSGLPLQPGET